MPTIKLWRSVVNWFWWSLGLIRKSLAIAGHSFKNQVYEIEDRYGINVSVMPQEVRDKYRRLLLDLKRVEKDLQKLRGR